MVPTRCRARSSTLGRPARGTIPLAASADEDLKGPRLPASLPSDYIMDRFSRWMVGTRRYDDGRRLDHLVELRERLVPIFGADIASSD